MTKPAFAAYYEPSRWVKNVLVFAHWVAIHEDGSQSRATTYEEAMEPQFPMWFRRAVIGRPDNQLVDFPFTFCPSELVG